MENDAREFLGILLRVPSAGIRAFNIFRMLRDAIRLYNGENQIDLNTLRKMTNGNINEFAYTKSADEDFKIFKNILKEYDIKYSIKKSNVLNEDGTRDYYFFFDAKNSTIVERAFKEYVKQMDAREEAGFEKRAEKAKEKAEKENEKSKDKSKDRDKNRDKNRNKDMNFDL